MTRAILLQHLAGTAVGALAGGLVGLLAYEVREAAKKARRGQPAGLEAGGQPGEAKNLPEEIVS